MPLQLTSTLIQEYADNYLFYINNRGRDFTWDSYYYPKRIHSAYDLTVEKYESLKVHADGQLPVNLITERRPSESDYIKAYREQIYVPITKGPISRVIASLSKIRRSTDWNIKFPEDVPATIREDERIEVYINEKFPAFKSLTNWLFTVALKKYLIDANAVVLVLPTNLDKDTTEYYKPYPFIFNAPRVLAFESDDYALLVDEKSCLFDVTDLKGEVIGTRNDGLIIHYIDRERYITFNQSGERTFNISFEWEHRLNRLPAFKMPGVYFDDCGDLNIIRESRISGMVPHLDEAARIYSDLQAELVQHVHSEKWVYMNTNCANCNGTGKVLINDDACTCEKCHGIGKIPTSPYTHHVVMPPDPMNAQDSVVTPPAGYIQKTDVAEMFERIDKHVDKHLYQSLAAINFQFLEQTPLNESGTAKEVDKDELNNTVHSIAEDIVYIGENVVEIINEYRYYGLIQDERIRKEMLPDIAVPEKFDLLSSTFLIDEITKAKQNNLNNLIISALETDYAAKKFYNEPSLSQLLVLVFSLDPMPATTEDEKIIRLQNQGVSQRDYVISSNIVPFIKRALREDEDYASKEFADQWATLVSYADEKMGEITVAGQIRSELQTEPELEEEEIVV